MSNIDIDDENIRIKLLALHPVLVNSVTKNDVALKDADDYAQETLTILWHKRYLLPYIENIEAYATTILKNLIKRDIKKEKQKAECIKNMDMDDISPPYGDIDYRDQQSIYCDRALDILTSFELSVVQARDMDEKSIRETAEMLNVSQYRVKTTLATAHEKMKEVILKLQKRDGY